PEIECDLGRRRRQDHRNDPDAEPSQRGPALRRPQCHQKFAELAEKAPDLFVWWLQHRGGGYVGHYRSPCELYSVLILAGRCRGDGGLGMDNVGFKAGPRCPLYEPGSFERPNEALSRFP